MVLVVEKLETRNINKHNYILTISPISLFSLIQTLAAANSGHCSRCTATLHHSRPPPNKSPSPPLLDPLIHAPYISNFHHEFIYTRHFSCMLASHRV